MEHRAYSKRTGKETNSIIGKDENCFFVFLGAFPKLDKNSDATKEKIDI